MHDMSSPFFPEKPQVSPTIYAYEDASPDLRGLLKVGYTTRDAASRVREQYPTVRPGQAPWKIRLEESAMRSDGSIFTDREIHAQLRLMGVPNPKGEWFKCGTKEVINAVLSVRNRQTYEPSRTQGFKMRPEQEAAVKKTQAYFKACKSEDKKATPHFLWNAKMRFGKTFATYQLAMRMGWKRVLVLTFKPAVQGAWEEDLNSHVDFEGWQFISPGGNLDYDHADKKRPIVCFGSFQDYLGKNKSTGGIKTKNEWVHAAHWDCVVLDEYHYGAWRESARELFEAEEAKEAQFAKGEFIEDFDEGVMPITTDAYLYLSGTPFRAIASGEFIEEQIFNWTYSDEQKAKNEWKGNHNPYRSLPKMVLMTYQLPEAVTDIASQGEFNEFDLNVFFEASGKDDQARFRYEDEVQKWIDIIRGSLPSSQKDGLKLGTQKPPLPFAHAPLLKLLSHTFWFLPSVSACHAMRNLLSQRQNNFFNTYKVVVAAGSEAGIGVDALGPVEAAMVEPLASKSITLSCGKLTTGVTVKPWSGIFMLRNCSSPETYFQAAFRVQSPWVVRGTDGSVGERDVVMKEVCYVFDFAPNRALRQIAEYSCRLDVNETNPESKVAEFISFLPVLAYDGSSMKQIDAAGILDMAMSGTTATLLARRWESALLVNVDNNTLQRLMDNKAAMDALMSIEGFRTLNQDIETIINKSDAVKNAKKKANEKEISPKKKKELSEAEKEYKSLRKEIQEKLIKFATRIPVFMYLSDYRERTLRDVITQLEPGLFKKVTGLTVKDFNLLVSLGVFNAALMNDAIYKFKRYEDSSLVYTGINKHEGEDVGLFDTVVSPAEFQQKFINEG